MPEISEDLPPESADRSTAEPIAYPPLPAFHSGRPRSAEDMAREISDRIAQRSARR
ncbi:hypothetical protein [Nocardia cyriacigeorgica]|uniref:hypothetical protein n=1 Tax=Nocardia cyriacigeorgica TaxID=135487 RepID=UPI001895350B|nr:hypothetical protein [Nocardia cyriacigeorgica]MBF6286836.1 hypothetical protein [Nocardia cyriacigeorgica]